MEIATCLLGKAAIYTVLVEPPQELMKETLLVQRWIEHSMYFSGLDEVKLFFG